MSSALAVLKEASRQALMQDNKFYTAPVYFFELRVPPELGAWGNSFLFPLALNPTDLSMDEPFAMEMQPTQGGGLYVEENGIVWRTLRIRGSTGFSPRPMNGDALLGCLPAPQRRSFGRSVYPIASMGISGQRHFQWLQDKVFRAYADLKADPSKSKGTELLFHNQKDDEHWLIKPQSFRMTRSKRVMYEYEIEMLVTAPGEAKEMKKSEDQGLFDSIKNVLRQVNNAINMVSGAISDITAVVEEIREIAMDVDTILDSCTRVAGALTDFANGVTALVNTPLAFVQSTIEAVEQTTAMFSAFENLGNAVTKLPDNIVNSFRQLQDGLEVSATIPAIYVVPPSVKMSGMLKRQQYSTNTSSAEFAATAAASLATLSAMSALGTGLMPGDAARSKVSPASGSTVPKYTSAREISIQDGDTLATLAARHLGDARLWKYIAVLNNLKPPFISNLAARDLANGGPLPGTLARGGTILIPSTMPAPTALTSLATYGVTPDQSTAAQLLGTDFALVSADGGQTYDIPIDVQGGSVDAQLVSGVPNLQQGLRTRLDVEEGQYVLYQRFGTKRIVGLGNKVADVESAKFRVQESIMSDPRIVNVMHVEFPTDHPDAFVTDITVEVLGFTQPTKIQVEVP
jgi:hypothetical protein